MKFKSFSPQVDRGFWALKKYADKFFDRDRWGSRRTISWTTRIRDTWGKRHHEDRDHWPWFWRGLTHHHWPGHYWSPLHAKDYMPSMSKIVEVRDPRRTTLGPHSLSLLPDWGESRVWRCKRIIQRTPLAGQDSCWILLASLISGVFVNFSWSHFAL